MKTNKCSITQKEHLFGCFTMALKELQSLLIKSMSSMDLKGLGLYLNYSIVGRCNTKPERIMVRPGFCVIQQDVLQSSLA